MCYFLLYVMFIATLNLGLGFGIAAYLGRRYRYMLASAQVDARGTLGGLADGSAPDSAPQTAEVAAHAGSAAADPGQPSIAAQPPAAHSEAAAELAALAAEAGGQDGAIGQAGAKAAAPTSGQTAGQQSGARTFPSQSNTLAAVAGMQSEVDRYQHKLGEADEALRSRIGPADAEEIEATLSSLIAATDEYLSRREQFRQNLEVAWSETEQLAPVRQQLAQAVEGQDQQIQISKQVFEGFDPQGDIPTQCAEAITCTSRLVAAGHRLRDVLDEAAEKAAATERTGGRPEVLAAKDALTGVDSRASLGERVRQWQQRDPHRIRQLAVGLIDIDRCGKINEQFGHKVGDRLLRAVGQILSSETRGQCECARIAGQRFALFCPDAAVRSVTQLVERIRQLIEVTRFHLEEQQIQVTVSCGVAALRREDQSEELFARVEGALREAKRYGRNRTFVHEGDYPTPVVPPNFAMEEKHFTL